MYCMQNIKKAVLSEIFAKVLQNRIYIDRSAARYLRKCNNMRHIKDVIKSKDADTKKDIANMPNPN